MKPTQHVNDDFQSLGGDERHARDVGGSEQEVLKKLRRDAKEAEALFSNSGQELQERTVVAGLLRALGVDFHEHEIAKCDQEPIDVSFRNARFQVTEILDQRRRRNLEIKERSARVKAAERLQDLVDEGVVSSRPMAPNELIALVFECSKKKARRYAGECGNIDLLIYVNMRQRHLYPSAPFSEAAAIRSIGWRSISVVTEPFAVVLWAADDAPVFLVKYSGQAIQWKGLDSVFPRLGAD
jgi:hypothetical protein